MKRKIGQELIVAMLFALFITSYVEYVYEGFNVSIGSINLFPLVGWTAGLVFLRELYERLTGRYRFLVATAAYLIILFALEYIGYYLLGIRLTGNYQSLFGLGIIHGPIAIHLFYLFAGPLYLLVTDYLRVE